MNQGGDNHTQSTNHESRITNHESRTTILFAGGGTGGHLFPALAIIEWFREHHPSVQCEFLCTQKQLDQDILTQWKVPFATQTIVPLRTTIRGLIAFFLAWRKSLRLCYQRFESLRPTVVVGTGGYGSGPAAMAAQRLGIPCALLNPDAVPGRANRFLARRADEIYIQWEESREHFPRTQHVLHTGCPVRKAFVEPKTERDYKFFNLSPQRHTLLVTGASQGAHNINEAMITLLPDLSSYADWQFIHLTGDQDFERTQAAYRLHGIRAWVRPFTDAMPAAMRCADLALARAGAVTLAELSATGTPAILMPYPYDRERHQQANAQMLAGRGAAVLVTDQMQAELNAQSLGQALRTLMDNADQLIQMTDAAHRPTREPATETISSRLLCLATKKAASSVTP